MKLRSNTTSSHTPPRISHGVGRVWLETSTGQEVEIEEIDGLLRLRGTTGSFVLRPHMGNVLEIEVTR